ncbi:hypothetical protein Huta_2074 [Halorhabdus utahensis DSM 12940]|uniref:Uncharacterized protein n=1 Tax=Halorhabdus utahensis (strain DSM 12940 / JCM 11049 / AX-2) TaxID=519442 RepID=C7NTZ6_HALUD|nr:hypothetical protein [Halorhabdus utahensis]ACV12241.1 hypothetical protein Huta_2074 [Halorhabdus utahensis DSM 12940]
MTTEFAIDPDRLEEFLPMLGKEIEDGYIVDIETGQIATSPSGEKIKAEEVGYLAHGSVEPIRDDISDIVNYLTDSSDWEDPRE